MLDRLLDPRRQPEGGDPLDSLIADERRRQSIAALGSATNPDAAAKANRLAKETGVPATTVEANLKYFEGDKNARLWAELIAKNPKLAAWLEQPRNAAIASDDRDAVASVAAGFDYDEWAKRTGINPRDKLSPAGAPKPTLWNSVKGVVSSLFTGWEKAQAAQQLFGADWLPIGMPKAATGVPDINSPSAIAARQETRFRTIDQAQARERAMTPGFTSWIGSGIYSGFQSAAAMAPAIAAGVITRNATIPLVVAGVQAGVPAYGKYRARGGAPTEALVGGIGEGGVEVIAEKIPMGFLVNKFGKIGAGRFLAEYLGRELPGELAATMAQDAIDTAIANPDKTWGDYWAERPNALLQTAISTLTVSALTAGGSGVTKRLARSQGEAVSAEAGIEFLDDMAARVAESKTRARDPEAFSALLKTLGGDVVDNVFIPGEAVREYLQSDEGHDRDFWAPLDAQISEAQATGGDVVIPADQALAHLAGTKAWAALREDMRLTPGGMSLREATQFEGEAAGSIERAATDATAQLEADRIAAEPRQRLYDSVYAKLTNAGFTPDAARMQADLVTARAATRAARIGTELTGAEFDATQVNQVLPERLRPLVAAKSLDMVVAAMRRNRDPKAARSTPSLLEWISKQGGVEDRGGDIASMGGDKWHRAKPGRRKLIRATAQGSMLGEDGQQNTNSPDELAVRAQEAGYFLPGERPTQNDLLDAIGEELRGTPRYAEEAQPDDLRMAAQELFKLLEQEGVDPDKASDAEIKSFVQRYQEGAGEGRSLDQSFMDGPRGRVTFTEGRNIVDLFEKRDLSTFIHEVGHIWLEELKADAESAEAPDQVRGDWETVKAWFASNGQAIGEDGAIPTDAHELWARGVERFTMEGKAPSSALRRAFKAFRSWLLTIYQVVDNLRSPISPEVRDVMARLVATDEEITAATEEQNVRALFTDAAAAGMTEAEFAAYQSTVAGARDAAHDALLYRTMSAVRAQRTAEYKGQRETVRMEVAESVNNRREFRAIAILRDSASSMRLDKQFLIDTYGADALDLIPANVPPLYKENGSSADAIAEMAGFETGDDMIRSLMGIELRRKEMRAAGDKRSVRDSVIEDETDAIMADRYGDPLADGSIEREARELIHNDRQGEVIASELRALSRKRPNLQPTPYQLAKRWAARKVAEGTVSDYTSRGAIQRFQRAARKAGEAAETAMLKGDVDETFRQKQAQMLNNALIAEAARAADAVDAAVSRLGKIAKRRTMKSVDQDYLEQAQALLEQVELRQRSQISIDKQGKFEAWARDREAEGHDVIVPPSFSATLGTTHYSRLSVETLLGLDDAVKQIMHLGRMKQTLLDGKEQREFDAVVAEAIDAAGRLPPKPPSDLMEPSWLDRFKSGVASADGALLRMETVFDWLDGGSGDGVFNRIVFRPVADAQHRENAMIADYYGRIREAMSSVPKETLKRWSDKATIPELVNRETGNPWVMTRQQLVSMALNMGNEGNIQRLTDGYGWSEQAVREVLNRELTAPEWTLVQQIWDVIDTLWPEISAMERRINGVEPDKVEATPFETPHGTLRGGYFPAVYDSAKDLRAEANAGKESDKFGSLYTRATTRASSTKDRSQKVSRPILLQLGVINRHLGEVIHDITHREAVMQADKFLSSERVMRAVDQSLGPEIRKQFQPWLKFIANSWALERAGNEGIVNWINKARTNATIVGMGYRITTMMTQIAGYSNSFEYVGAQWVTEAIARTSAHPIESYRFVTERSGEVRNRMNTLDRDIRESISKMAGKRDLLSDAKRFAFHGIGYADRVVVIPTWLGAYNKALAAGASETEAIYAGDKAVRMSQGAGSPKDLAAIQRGTGTGGAMLKMLTMFYSYMSTVYQRQRTLGRDVGAAVRDRDYRMTPRLLARSWWLLIVPPLLSDVLSGRGPDEEEEWGWYAIKKMLSQALGPIPVVRDIFEPAWNKAAGNKAFDYQLSPIQAAGTSVVKVAEDAGRMVRGDEVKAPVKDVMLAAGYVTGLVPGQIATSTQFLIDVGQGEQDPETVAEWYIGITKGKIPEDAN